MPPGPYMIVGTDRHKNDFSLSIDIIWINGSVSDTESNATAGEPSSKAFLTRRVNCKSR